MTDTTPPPEVVELEVSSFLDPELTAELDAWMATPVGTETDLIADQADVDRLLAAVQLQRRKREQLKEVCRTRVDDIQAFYNLRDGQLEAEEARLTRLLEQWGLSYAQATGTRTVTLPHGAVKVTRRRPRVIVDETIPEAEREASLSRVEGAVTAERVVKFHKAPLRTGTGVGGPVRLDTRPDLAEQVPDGYQLRFVTVPDPDTGEITQVWGAYVLVPLDGWQGDTVTVTT